MCTKFLKIPSFIFFGIFLLVFGSARWLRASEGGEAISLTSAETLRLLRPSGPRNDKEIVKPVEREEYLAYARSSAEWTWQHYDELIDRWKESFDPENVFGYRPPGGLLEMAVISAYLFDKEQDRKYAQRAKKALLIYRRLPFALSSVGHGYQGGLR